MSRIHLRSIQHQLAANAKILSSSSIRSCHHGLAHCNMRSISHHHVLPPQAMTVTLSTHHQRSQVDTPPSPVSDNPRRHKHTKAVEEESYVANIRKILGSRRLFATEQALPENIPLPLLGQERLEDKVLLEKHKEVTQEQDDFSPPTTCCMSGCHTCVWIEYVDRLSKHYADPNLGRDKIRQEVNTIEDANIRAVLIMELKFRGLW